MKLPKAVTQDMTVTYTSGLFVIALTPEQLTTLRSTLADGVQKQEDWLRPAKEIKAVNWKSMQKQYEEARSVQKNLERAVDSFVQGVK